jgi:hypothetical protein
VDSATRGDANGKGEAGIRAYLDLNFALLPLAEALLVISNPNLDKGKRGMSVTRCTQSARISSPTGVRNWFEGRVDRIGRYHRTQIKPPFPFPNTPNKGIINVKRLEEGLSPIVYTIGGLLGGAGEDE